MTTLGDPPSSATRPGPRADGRSSPADPRRVHPAVERLAAYGWRLLVLAAVLVGFVWLLRRLWVVVLALAVAVLLARVLNAPNTWLRARGAPPSLAASGALLVLAGLFVLLGWFIVPAMADEFDSLGPTVTEAVDEVERWLVEDAPFGLDERELGELRGRVEDAVSNAFRSSSSSLVSSAFLAIEVLTGLVLAIVATFFILKDGPRFQAWVLRRLPDRRRELARRLGARAWRTLGGYLKGAAILGALEAVAIGITLTLVGAKLALPVAVLTFAAAFVPMIGAVVAGVLAVLIALATAGFGGAVIVAVVALAVQQLDNDVLAPAIYGRALALHPLIVLFAVVAGGALFGLAGTVLAVPVTAVLVNSATEAADARRDATAEPPPVE